MDRFSIWTNVNPPRSFSPSNIIWILPRAFLWRQIFQWLILSQVPDHHRSGSVLARRNHALKLRIWMVLRPYGQAFVRRVHRRPFGYCPGCQDVICGQPKIIMKPTGIVLLDDKVAAATISPRSPNWLERFGKGSLGRYAVSDIVLPSTVLPIRQRD